MCSRCLVICATGSAAAMTRRQRRDRTHWNMAEWMGKLGETKVER